MSRLVILLVVAVAIAMCTLRTEGKFYFLCRNFQPQTFRICLRANHPFSLLSPHAFKLLTSPPIFSKSTCFDIR